MKGMSHQDQTKTTIASAQPIPVDQAQEEMRKNHRICKSSKLKTKIEIRRQNIS